MKLTLNVEESLIDVLRETDLLTFQTKFAFEKQLTRLEHFSDVTDDELMVIKFVKFIIVLINKLLNNFSLMDCRHQQ